MPDDPEHAFVLRRANQALADLAVGHPRRHDNRHLSGPLALMRDLRGKVKRPRCQLVGGRYARTRWHEPQPFARSGSALNDDGSRAPFEILLLTGWSP